MFSHEQLVAILSTLPDPALILTRSGRYAGIFGGIDARYYHDGRGLIGKTIRDIVPPELAEWFLGEIAAALASRKLQIVEYRLAGGDVKGLPEEGPAEPIWFEGRIQALPFPVDGEDAELWVASNITARHDLERRLTEQSEMDALTGLWNRRHFEKTAHEEMKRSARYGHPISMLMIDVDQFKAVNDRHGHQAGDDVLVALGGILRDCTRSSDPVTRWGGEEFVILMPNTGLDAAGAAAEKIRHAVESCDFPGNLWITLCVGAAEWRRGESLDRFIFRADAALYAAKHSGRNRIALAEPDMA